MLSARRQAASSVSSLVSLPRSSVCACRLPVAGHVLCRSSVVNASQFGYSGFLGNSGRFFSRYVQGLVSHRLPSEPPWRTVFFGTDEYALVHLKAMNENR